MKLATILSATCLALMPAALWADTAPVTAKGQITTTGWVPETYDDAETKLVRIHVTETFTGDLSGTGTVEFLQALRPDGSASFVGLERFTGTLNGKQGTFVLQDQGMLQGDTVTGTWTVVKGSGTGELAGLHGEGGFTAKLGTSADITLTYGFD